MQIYPSVLAEGLECTVVHFVLKRLQSVDLEQGRRICRVRSDFPTLYQCLVMVFAFCQIGCAYLARGFRHVSSTS